MTMTATDVLVRPLAEANLDEADRIFRLAFGTGLGMPDPMRFAGDADTVRTRWKADPAAAFVAEVDGRLAGSNFAANWGSVGIFGPLTVAPEHWGHGVGQRLLDRTMELFTRWNTRHIGLFTFAHSPKQVGLYQKYGFWPRYLTAIMARPAETGSAPFGSTVLSEVPNRDLPGTIRAIAELTDSIYLGLDVGGEIDAVMTQKLGDTVLLDDAAGLQALAVCHIGPGSEAGSGTCFIKFAAVRPGPDADRGFGRLLDACQQLAAERGASVLLAGANAGCDRAWTAMTARGFRPLMQGVAMHRPNDAGYHTSDRYVIDDWR
jgi:GNAT superfamily N-acetyltransferase